MEAQSGGKLYQGSLEVGPQGKIIETAADTLYILVKLVPGTLLIYPIAGLMLGRFLVAI